MALAARGPPPPSARLSACESAYDCEALAAAAAWHPTDPSRLLVLLGASGSAGSGGGSSASSGQEMSLRDLSLHQAPPLAWSSDGALLHASKHQQLHRVASAAGEGSGGGGDGGGGGEEAPPMRWRRAPFAPTTGAVVNDRDGAVPARPPGLRAADILPCMRWRVQQLYAIDAATNLEVRLHCTAPSHTTPFPQCPRFTAPRLEPPFHRPLAPPPAPTARHRLATSLGAELSASRCPPQVLRHAASAPHARDQQQLHAAWQWLFLAGGGAAMGAHNGVADGVSLLHGGGGAGRGRGGGRGVGGGSGGDGRGVGGGRLGSDRIDLARPRGRSEEMPRERVSSSEWQGAAVASAAAAAAAASASFWALSQADADADADAPPATPPLLEGERHLGLP